MNSFGQRFRWTTFGESHGKAIGVVLDGVPAGLAIDLEFIQNELDRRKPGQNRYQTQRKESDTVQILSGVFDGVSTGTSLAMVIYNEDQKSKDYSNIKELFRPAHADWTYFQKYGIRDYRGGGRSSARETACRVAVGAIAKLLLKEFNIEVHSGVCQIGDIKCKNIDFKYAKTSPIYTLDKGVQKQQTDLIKQISKEHDSIGAVVLVKATGVIAGLGEPMYHKLDGAIGGAMMGLNGVKAVEIGDGTKVASAKGSHNNDTITKDGFATNHSGGILGGISNGDNLTIKIYFKPTPSIYKTQQTIDTNSNNVTFNLKGRHDPCIGIRGSVVCELMLASILADMLLLNTTSKLENVKKAYSKNKNDK